MSSSQIELEYEEINSKENWIQLFQSIREKCENEAKDKHFTLEESKKLQNRKFNRYRDVNPYDHSRICLHRGDTDYINANLVKLDRADRKYILTQGPLEQTVGHFWLMIWEQNSKAILMLNKLIEKKQVKCHMYWPENIGPEHAMFLTDVGLSIEYLKCEEFNNFSKRIFRLTDIESTKSREIIQFHYTTWPDFGIPSSPVAFLQFLKQVRESDALNSDVGPIVVHCSAGIGRSGTFCLVDCCLVLIKNEGENKVSVQEILLELRRYRMGLIQTVDQLYFSYQAIIEGIKRLNNPNISDDYEVVPDIEEEKEDDDDLDDDIPPPLPPPRIDSKSSRLQICDNNLHENLLSRYNNEKINNEKETINNLVNIEKSRNYDSNNYIDRPLPALPKEISLEKVNESGSDNDIINNDIDDDNEDDDDDEYIDENNSDIDLIENNDKLNLKLNSIDNEFNPNNTLPPIPSSDKNNIEKNGPVYDLDSPISSPESDRSQNTEIRRRKRIERQTVMEDKIREIKRKQKASEENTNSSSPNKRRFASIAAGVIIGVICVYAYMKFVVN